jgi:hypothetical protein
MSKALYEREGDELLKRGLYLDLLAWGFHLFAWQGGAAASCSVVRHECAWSHIRKSVRNCARNEGRPLGVGLQEQAPNRLKLRW